jgi:putative restriction endonuclease
VGLPVRVLRGAEGDPTHSPPSGYRYDALYHVTDYWQKVGQDGFKIWQFRLVEQAPVTRQMLATKVQVLHNHTCQICGVQLQTAVGPYAEAAHIRALGAPNGCI